MSKIRLVAHIGVISFTEFLKKKAQAYVPGDPTALSPVEDLGIGQIFTPQQKKILENPASVADLKKVIDEFPEIMNDAVNQINMLPKEQYLQGEYFLNSLLEYFDQIKFLYEAMQDSLALQPSEDFDVPFLEPEELPVGKPQEKTWDEDLAESGMPNLSELTEPIGDLELALANLYDIVTSTSSDDIAYSPSQFKRSVLQSFDKFVNQLTEVTPIIETAFDAFA